MKVCIAALFFIVFVAPAKPIEVTLSDKCVNTFPDLYAECIAVYPEEERDNAVENLFRRYFIDNVVNPYLLNGVNLSDECVESFFDTYSSCVLEISIDEREQAAKKFLREFGNYYGFVSKHTGDIISDLLEEIDFERLLKMFSFFSSKI